MSRSAEKACGGSSAPIVGGAPQPSARDVGAMSAADDAAGAAERKKEDDERLERAAFLKIVRAMQNYASDAAEEVHRWETNFERLSPAHQALLSHHREKHVEAYRCVQQNDAFLSGMLAAFSGDDVPPHLRVPPPGPGPPDPVAPGDVEKVRYVLKNLSRDWSAEAAEERAQSHGPIIAELQARLKVPHPSEGRYPPRVMVPGAGLGRLVMECARLGYETEGNEYSYYMLLTSSYILNHATRAGEFDIFPWIHGNNNHTSDANHLRRVPIPDLPACEAGIQPGCMSMCAGDFVEVYGAPEQVGQWDAVATCFFIDTAHNVVEYLEIISRCLRPGGVWVNFGPLLYHWADARSYLSGEELSVEMSLEDVERVAKSVGLNVVKREMRDSLYTADKRSMCQTVYRCALLVAVKQE